MIYLFVFGTLIFLFIMHFRIERYGSAFGNVVVSDSIFEDRIDNDFPKISYIGVLFVLGFLVISLVLKYLYKYEKRNANLHSHGFKRNLMSHDLR